MYPCGSVPIDIPTVEHVYTPSIFISTKFISTPIQTPKVTFEEPTSIQTSDQDNEFTFDPTDSYQGPATEAQQLPPIITTEPPPAPDTTPISAGTSSRGRPQKMSRAMQDSVAQNKFFGTKGMHMAAQALAVYEDPYLNEDDFHDWYLNLQDCMNDQISFYAEMMDDILYLHQVLCQPDAVEFVKKSIIM